MPGRINKVALITGAAGGLGRALAMRLAADGYDLVLTDVASCGGVSKSLGACVKYAASCDLESVGAVDGFISEVLSRTNVDCVINNAAHQRQVLLADLTAEDLGYFNRINIEAPFQLAKGFSAAMIEKEWGRIVNVVSSQAWSPLPGFMGYVTSKMGLIGLTRALASELGPYGITANAITPSLTRTETNEHAVPPEVWAAIREKQKIKRTATPEDFVGAVAFLLTEDARFLTGQTICVDGGLVML